MYQHQCFGFNNAQCLSKALFLQEAEWWARGSFPNNCYNFLWVKLFQNKRFFKIISIFIILVFKTYGTVIFKWAKQCISKDPVCGQWCSYLNKSRERFKAVTWFLLCLPPSSSYFFSVVLSFRQALPVRSYDLSEGREG